MHRPTDGARPSRLRADSCPPNANYRRTTKYTYGNPVTANGKPTTLLKTEVRTDLGGTAAWRSTWRFSDGLGRTVQEYADAVGGVDVVNSTHNILGLKTKDTMPRRSTNPTGSVFESDWLDGTIKATTYSYDGRRRLRITTLPGPAGNQPQVKQNYDDEDDQTRFGYDWDGS